MLGVSRATCRPDCPRGFHLPDADRLARYGASVGNLSHRGVGQGYGAPQVRAYFRTGLHRSVPFGRLIWLMILAMVFQYGTVVLVVGLRELYRHYGRRKLPPSMWARATGRLK